MFKNISIFVLFFDLAFIGVVLELVRRKKLKEQYSLLWFTLGAVMFIFVIFEEVTLIKLANFLEIAYPPSALFILGLIFVLILVLHYSVVISKLSSQNIRLAQEIAILSEKISKKESNNETHNVHFDNI